MKKIIIIAIFFSFFDYSFSQWSCTFLEHSNYKIQFINQSTGWTGGGGSFIYKTTNCGINWINVYAPYNQNNITGFYFINENTGWAVTYSGIIMKTINSGFNWNTYSSIYNKTIYHVFFADENTGWYVGMEGSIGKSTNGGISWFNPGIIFTGEANSVYFLNSFTGFVCGSGFFAKTINGGSNWEVSSYSNVNFNSIYFLNNNTGWFFGNHYVGNSSALCVFKTTNMGNNWNILHADTNIEFNHIAANGAFFFNDNLGYLAGTFIHSGPTYSFSGFIKKTTNSGINWMSINQYFYDYMEDVSFINAQTGFAVGHSFLGSGTIFKTTNGGVSPAFSISGTVRYSDNNQPVTSGTVKAFKLDKNTSNIIVFDTAVIQTDGSYTLPNVPQDSVDIGVFPNSTPPNDYVITYYPSTIYWEHSTTLYPTGNLANINIGAIRMTASTNSNSVNGKVMRLNDNPLGNLKDAVLYAKNGNTFVRCAVSEGNGVYHLNSLPTGNLKILATRLGFSRDSVNVNVTSTSNTDSINFYLSRMYVGIKQINSTIPSEYKLFQNYPNPFNPVTNIKYQITNNKLVTLKIYNILGIEVATLVNEKQEPGVYEVMFDASNLPSGIYFYRLQTENFTETKRLVLIK